MSVLRRIVFAAICWLLGMLVTLAVFFDASDEPVAMTLFGLVFGGVFIALGSILFYEAVRLMANPETPFIDIDTRLGWALQAFEQRYPLRPILCHLLYMVPLTTYVVLDVPTGHPSLPIIAAVASLTLIIITLEVLRWRRVRRTTPPTDGNAT